MADNYLEKKFEALGHAHTVHGSAPSLDTLLQKVGEQEVMPCDQDGVCRVIRFSKPGVPGYKVLNAQLEAMIHSARRLGIPFEATCDELSSSIRLSCRSSVALGQVILAVRLKASALFLDSELVFSCD